MTEHINHNIIEHKYLEEKIHSQLINLFVVLPMRFVTNTNRKWGNKKESFFNKVMRILIIVCTSSQNNTFTHIKKIWYALKITAISGRGAENLLSNNIHSFCLPLGAEILNYFKSKNYYPRWPAMLLFNYCPLAKAARINRRQLCRLLVAIGGQWVTHSVTNQILHCGSVSVGVCAEYRRCHSRLHWWARCWWSETRNCRQFISSLILVSPKINLLSSQIFFVPVVSEVALDQMPCRKCRHEGQLSGKYCATHYSCKSVGILARFRFAGTYARKISVIAWLIEVKNSYPWREGCRGKMPGRARLCHPQSFQFLWRALCKWRTDLFHPLPTAPSESCSYCCLHFVLGPAYKNLIITFSGGKKKYKKRDK